LLKSNKNKSEHLLKAEHLLESEKMFTMNYEGHMYFISVRRRRTKRGRRRRRRRRRIVFTRKPGADYVAPGKKPYTYMSEYF
jgi:hypothetical protein